MPRTFGRNQIHMSQVLGWSEADYPLLELTAGAGERGRHGESPATSPSGCPTAPRSQTGIGAIPNAILSALG